MNDTIIPNLKMAETHANMIREELDSMDYRDPSVMMLKALADDVIDGVRSAIANIEE